MYFPTVSETKLGYGHYGLPLPDAITVVGDNDNGAGENDA